MFTMPSNKANAARLSSVISILVAILLIVSGCGTGEYERRLADRTNRIRTESRFNELYAPQDLPGVPVAVRVPVKFTDPPLVEGAPDKAGQPVDPRRLKPIPLDVPWLKLTYEGMVDNPQGGKLPYYCYVGAVDMAAGGVANPAAAWSAELAGKGGTVADWTDFQGESPDGRTVPWRKLRFTGNQNFYTLDAGNQGQFVQLPGILDVYLHEENGFLLLMAWRMPSSVEQQVDPAKWAALMAGCFAVKK